MTFLCYNYNGEYYMDDMKKKDSNVLKVVILSIVVIVVVLGGLFVYKTFFNKEQEGDVDVIKEDKNNQETENKEEIKKVNLNITDDLVVSLMKRYKYELCSESDALFKKIYAGNMTIKNLTKKEVLISAISMIEKLPTCTVNKEMKRVSLDTINRNVRQTFPSLNIKFTADDILALSIDSNGYRRLGDYNILIEDNKKNLSIESINCDGCGIGPVDYAFTKIVSAEKEGENVYIYQKLAYMTSNFEDLTDDQLNNGMWYTNVSDSLNNKDKVTQVIKKNAVLENDINWDLLRTYKWTFTPYNGTYYLSSVVLEK